MINREHIGIFGKMNAGKSSVMNLITQQQTSITDPTPGTTADVKISLIELHGLGPVKLFDTAGIDESSFLGEKKREKTHNTLKDCDLILLVIDPTSSHLEHEQKLIDFAKETDKQVIVIFNIFSEADRGSIDSLRKNNPSLQFYPSITISAIEEQQRQKLLDFILQYYEPTKVVVELLPFIKPNEFYVLNIPMDEETPRERYLRPQAMAEEYITRHWAYPVSYRMNLALARDTNNTEEKERFESFLCSFKQKPHVLITDSQAMDIIADWVPPEIKITTFSVMMINYMSKGRLNDFYLGAKVLETLKAGDKILIAEACNHSRIKEDIGTKQIPSILNKQYPGVSIDFNFGREFEQNKNLNKYNLIIHCGACMISQQKFQSRLRDLRSVGIPITNYGFFLSQAKSAEALERVMEPWIKA
jgi:[FeFe] hydrogenase H-cluster maturation GTPase HydF